MYRGWTMCEKSVEASFHLIIFLLLVHLIILPRRVHIYWKDMKKRDHGEEKLLFHQGNSQIPIYSLNSLIFKAIHTILQQYHCNIDIY